MLSTRNQLLVAVAATLLGITGMAAYGKRALDKASGAAEHARASLSRIYTVARLEEQLHLFEAEEEGLEPGEEEFEEIPEGERADPAKLEHFLTTLEDADWDDEANHELVHAIATEIRRDVAAGKRRWSDAERLVSRLEKRTITASRDAVEDEMMRPAHERARILAGIGGGLVVIFGALSTLAFLRYRREREESLAKLRKSDRLAALGTIAASLAHELNNPLATVQGCAAAVRERLRRSGEDHEDSIEYLEMIESETRRCSGLVDSLRDLARDTPLAVTSARLGELAREVVALVEMSGDEKRVRFEVDVPEEVELMCDPDKVKQLLLNLVVNARDACADGGRVGIRIGADAVRSAVVVVEDDGHGIDPRELPRVFEAFRTGKTRGLGLGLFLCERIARVHGGEIRAESDGPGRGSRFVVTLPTRLGEAVAA